MLSVKTVDEAGNTISGYYTTLSQGGSQVQSGFSPAQFSLDAGETYEVSVADYDNYVFSRWDDGSTSRTRSVSTTEPIDTTTTLTAHYTSKQATLTVASVDNNSGEEISGLWTVIKKDGATLKTGYTPVSYSGSPGTYEVAVADYKNNEFDRWDDGSTSSTRQLAVSGEVKVSAYYDTGGPSEVRLTVKTVGLDRSSISGLWTVIKEEQAGGSQTTGFSPVRYDANAGTSYTVTVADYRNYIFDHWDNGSKDRSRKVTPDDDTVIVAYYKKYQ
jgi:hypothetical protein